MARYTGPKNRLARREGADLGLKTPGGKSHSQLLKRLKITPGQHGQKRKRKPSDYGIQLREKQKVKRIYGVLEKQFRKYFQAATSDKRNTGEALLALLERRLDNVIYRLNLAPTRSSARQFITHGHIMVDNRKVDIPSFLVIPGMIITFKQDMLENPHVKKMLEIKDPQISPWLARRGPIGKVVKLPKRDDIAENINEQLIIEFYSR
ncbi:30S ribosomal protein S4 [Candidatus Gottesmanbacteria bacterium RIFCSPHIGHO2_02_FULL_39_14]|uniref:Small ribosomal subunit protein uS4 n=2 Tax=Candidatus Gottesmaniibacteriota TaxID=1752720 RepID=A0A1F5ZV03_9BACT|nr:MAG: 30S ribosomal protein S4 [Candidatus Gottesmanbacteria bacterium RIFCSPHIGHO2_02_FULL_39_14]OGG31106.1 MAG: 30S ribosomal protein S4 [Candidatus Gottesmanbacteria bacterium RIFCSPLOWO2_02_FULL_38_8]